MSSATRGRSRRSGGGCSQTKIAIGSSVARAAVITKGSYVGEKAEIDHIVPIARYPEFANELANLGVLPARQNRVKGDRMGEVEFAKLKELQRLTPRGP
jgi:hypothetical protein